MQTTFTIAVAFLCSAAAAAPLVTYESHKWSSGRMEEMLARAEQGDLLAEEWRKTFKVIPKLPIAFPTNLRTPKDVSRHADLDWEIGALYWNCYCRHGNNETMVLEKVCQKYFTEFLQTDIHL